MPRTTKMADRTGGRIYLASTLGNLAECISKIASELREFYSLGYYLRTGSLERRPPSSP